jgi:hypothetical protein
MAESAHYRVRGGKVQSTVALLQRSNARTPTHLHRVTLLGLGRGLLGHPRFLRTTTGTHQNAASLRQAHGACLYPLALLPPAHPPLRGVAKRLPSEQPKLPLFTRAEFKHRASG